MLIDKTEPENYNKVYSDDHFVIYEVLCFPQLYVLSISIGYA